VKPLKMQNQSDGAALPKQLDLQQLVHGEQQLSQGWFSDLRPITRLDRQRERLQAEALETCLPQLRGCASFPGEPHIVLSAVCDVMRR
jgi:hypothetical protein